VILPVSLWAEFGS